MVYAQVEPDMVAQACNSSPSSPRQENHKFEDSMSNTKRPCVLGNPPKVVGLICKFWGLEFAFLTKKCKIYYCDSTN